MHLLRQALAVVQARGAATSEILALISRSRVDPAPVFDAIARHSAKLCNAQMALSLPAAEVKGTFRLVGYHGLSSQQLQPCDVFELDTDPGAITGVGRDRADDLGRALGDRLLGLYRKGPLPFTPDDIALLDTFAAQAVIAIENARQFRQTQEALVRKTASAEILRVISSSTSDIQPVFDLIARKAAELCGARF